MNEYTEFIAPIFQRSKEFAIKLVFSSINKPQFLPWIKFTYENYPDIFYKNLSLIVGIYNEYTLSENEIREMAKEEYEKHEEYLNAYIEKEYRDTFRQNWYATARKEFFDKRYKIPCYGSTKTLVEIYEYLSTDREHDKLYWAIVNIMNKYIDEVPPEYFKIKNKNIEKKNEVKYDTFAEHYRFVRD